MATYLNDQSRVHLPALRLALCGNRHKLPKDFTCDEIIALFTLTGGGFRCLGHYHIIVTPSAERIESTRFGPVRAKSSKHRIFAKFGKRLIPVGRLAQAKMPEPVDPPGC